MIWTYRGTDLSTLGHITVIENTYSLSKPRGENLVVPFRPGRLFVAKVPDQRYVSLGLEVDTANLGALETRMDTIKSLFGQFGLGALVHTFESAATRTVQAEFIGDLSPTQLSPFALRLVLEFNSPDPFWRGASVIADNTTIIDTSPHAMTVNNTGTAIEYSPTITIDGPFSSITLTNTTHDPDVSLTYTGAIGASETVTIGVLNGEFYATLSTGSADVIGNLTHSGSSSLFPLLPGNNTLAITSAGGDNSGSVKISFLPPFL